MNTPKIIEALEKAKSDGLKFGRGMYYNEIQNKYCTIGGLAHVSGASDGMLILANANIVDIASMSAGDRLETIMQHDYDLDVEDLQILIGLSDGSWASWDDAINHFKELQNGAV